MDDEAHSPRGFYRTSDHPRISRDNYPTPPELTAALIVGLDRLGIELPAPMFDPCAGEGRLLNTLDALGLPAFGSDLFPDDYPRRKEILADPIDARDPDDLYEVLGGCRSLVTNPPYKDEAAKVARACCLLVQVDMVELLALLLPLPFEAAGEPERLALMRSPYFRARIVCCWRPEWIAGTGGGGTMNYAWFVWTRFGTGNTTAYVSRAEAMRELGMDEGRGRGHGRPPRQEKAVKPASKAARRRSRKPSPQLELALNGDAMTIEGSLPCQTPT